MSFDKRLERSRAIDNALKNAVSLDFEFRDTSEENPTLVSCVVQLGYQAPKSFWLFKSNKTQKVLAEYLRDLLSSKGRFLLSYAHSAEARCLYAMGINPVTIPAVDLYLEYKLLRNKNDKYNYGKYRSILGPLISIPPKRGKKSGDIKHKVLDFSLSAALYALCDIEIDEQHKDEMRDLILYSPRYEPCDIEKIILYNKQDVAYLPYLAKEIIKANRFFSLKEAVERGKFSASMGICESHGTPLNVGRIRNLEDNQPVIDIQLAKQINETAPIFEMGSQGRMVLKSKNWDEWVKSLGLSTKWPKTKRGFSQEGEVLKKFGAKYYQIESVRKSLELKKQLQAFRKGKAEKFKSNIGSDGHIRTSLMPFGTQSFRNAPKASSFIFAMASVLRALIDPGRGKVIVALDYQSQEFGVAAAVSRDPEMIAAYNSGDPYMYFAKQTGAIPSDGTRATHPATRDLYKVVVLMLQFQAGADAIHAKVNSDPSKPRVGLAQVRKVVSQHKRLFRVYWAFVDMVVKKYHKQGYLKLPGGYVLWGDNPNDRSTGNFVVQGMAAIIMHRASIYMHENELRYFAPLHDGFYLHLSEENCEGQIKIAQECLDRAVQDVLGDTISIRIDTDLHRHGEDWVEGKAKKHWEILQTYFRESVLGSMDELEI
jgi:hypothetical protein